ncbi:MAG: hypothetical protein ACRCWF_09930 [Beijerinckiaceae bacterium]
MGLSNHFAVMQLLGSALCAAAAFGVLLTMMLVRGNTRAAGQEGAVYDIAFTDKTYLIASILASIGALLSYRFSVGTFAAFVCVAISFQIAEHWLIPRLQAAAERGDTLPLTGARARFELVQAACLALVFFNISMPPLIILARVYGL